MRAEVSFANLGVREEARALVEQGGSITRRGWSGPREAPAGFELLTLNVEHTVKTQVVAL